MKELHQCMYMGIYLRDNCNGLLGFVVGSPVASHMLLQHLADCGMLSRVVSHGDSWRGSCGLWVSSWLFSVALTGLVNGSRCFR